MNCLHPQFYSEVHMLKVRDLRDSFTSFFREHEHRIVPSSSLIPKDDPTLLFTTAGMVQFKPMFAGTVDLEYTRAASIQKCFRTSDLENVGRTKRHLTMFEMLGNFSFGDYFKKEAIGWAWDFSTKVIKFPEEKIWVTIYLDDDEAFEIWNKHIGIPSHRIVRLGKEDNFWGPAGDSGACGPCSELYLDRGEAFGCGKDDCKPGCNCERFLEFWNLVFNQFNQDVNGVQTPLPRTGIDTGMGLERLATLVQGVDSVFETDELRNLVDFVVRETGVKYEGDKIIPVRVMVEHARSLTFAMSDGIYPSNEGRGYVLRRILRRALRFSRQLGLKEPFLYKMVDPVVAIMGDYYPEIKSGSANVKNVIEGEERRFLETIENGMDRLEEILSGLKKSGGKIIPGEDAFVLYDTFGFPLEMTVEMARERGCLVDIKAFEAAMESQRERGRASWKGMEGGFEKIFTELNRAAGESVFTGYDTTGEHTIIKALASDNGPVEKLTEGQRGFVVLEKTPFYGESGGQVGDKGEIKTSGGAIFRVDDTKKYNRTFIHLGEVILGGISLNEKADAVVDEVNRNLIRANHTVTHLVQASLRRVLGDHVRQSGSLVEPERMRFDFTHFRALNEEELNDVENLVNTTIWQSIPVTTKVMNLDEAVKTGATAIFDEKYEDTVRVVTVDDFSSELCGGTHVANTGQIGLFKIVRESSPGAGMRRIEGITLKSVLDRYNEQNRTVAGLVNLLDTPESAILKRVEDLVQRVRALEKEQEKARKENLSGNLDSLLASAELINGVKVISGLFEGILVDDLRDLADKIREHEQNSLVLFGSHIDDKAILLFAATKNSVEKGIDCGALIKKAAPLAGGGGGGRKDMAQAGGKNPAGLDAALKAALEMVRAVI